MSPSPAMALGGRRAAEDLALDVSRLMDGVREEVMTLMLDGVQKTASFCASLCAERIVAARREMQRRWAEERRELERIYGIPGNFGVSPMAMSPASSAFLPFAPGQSDSSVQTLPPVRAVPLVWQPEVPMPAMVKGPNGSLVNGHGSTLRGHSGASMAATTTVTPFSGLSPRTTSNLNGGPPLESYDASFIDAYDAVQTLEERTNMAARAMDLLDEALQAAAEATSSRPQSACSARSHAEAAAHVLQQADAASPNSFGSGSSRMDGRGDAVRARDGGAPERTEAAKSTEFDPVENGGTHVLPLYHSQFEKEDHIMDRRCHRTDPCLERSEFGGRSALRERSVASMSSGHASIPAADLHGA